LNLSEKGPAVVGLDELADIRRGHQMPMMVYTEEEVIEQLNKAEADGAARNAKALEDARSIVKTLRKILADADVTLDAHGKMDANTPLHERIRQALMATSD
jgi:pentose-5-phosphate-3-epimerase